MNRIIFALVFALFFVSIDTTEAQPCNEQLTLNCALQIGDNATYLKEFPVKLDRKRKKKPIPQYRTSIVLNKGTHYRFTICNSSDFDDSQAVLQLYDTNRLLGSNYDLSTSKYYKSFDFMCKKSAIYQIIIQFREGKEGCAVGILSYVR